MTLETFQFFLIYLARQGKANYSLYYRHTWVLSLFRKYSKNNELTKPAVTRFATSYLTLRCILDRKIASRAMFASEEWTRSTYACKFEAKKVQKIVLSDNRFWKATKYCLMCVLPLVKVLTC